MVDVRGMSGGKKFRLGLLGSGKGSNAAAIADACASGQVPAQVAIVISDVADAGILQRARERGLPAVFIAPGKFRVKLDEAAGGRLYPRIARGPGGLGGAGGVHADFKGRSFCGSLRSAW